MTDYSSQEYLDKLDARIEKENAYSNEIVLTGLDQKREQN